MKIYVAVVHKAWLKSGRPDGDWASFINKNKKEAIAAARKARARWKTKGYGPYQIWVGELTEVLKVPPVEYALKPIPEENFGMTRIPGGVYSMYGNALRGVCENYGQD